MSLFLGILPLPLTVWIRQKKMQSINKALAFS